MDNEALNLWLSTPPPAIESIACFNGAHDNCRDSSCSCDCGHGMRNLLESFKATTIPSQRVASLACVWQALFRVADRGRDGRPWCLDPTDESDAQTEHRYAYAQAVMMEVAALQAPPHSMDKRLLELVKEDMAEMRRVAKERMEQ